MSDCPAVAAQTYAKAAQLGLDAQNHAAEVKLRAERKAGELLAQLKRDTPQTANPSGLPKSNDGHGSSEYQAALEETGTSRQDAKRWQKIAGFQLCSAILIMLCRQSTSVRPTLRAYVNMFPIILDDPDPQHPPDILTNWLRNPEPPY